MISPKQQKILAFPYSKYDALICDGAVRSGKTSIMMWAFVRWAMENFSGQRFGVCGRTVDSCTKNIIVPFTAMSLAKERYIIRWRRGDKVMEVRRGAVTNYFEVFGGKDEASYTLIQGRTLAGVLLDEVVLMPRSFVEQALARCSVDGARLWFSCNPGSPHHWFYQEWIKRSRERNALYLHFEMTDNPGLSKRTLERYENMYAGIFYDRYVRGLWVAAEGIVYKDFANDTEKYLIGDPLEWAKQNGASFSIISIGVDFGGTKSATKFQATGITKDFRVVALEEEYIKNEEIAAEHKKAWEEARKLRASITDTTFLETKRPMSDDAIGPYNYHTGLNEDRAYNQTVYLIAVDRAKKFLSVENDQLVLNLKSGAEINIAEDLFQYITGLFDDWNKWVKEGKSKIIKTEEGYYDIEPTTQKRNNQ